MCQARSLSKKAAGTINAPAQLGLGAASGNTQRGDIGGMS